MRHLIASVAALALIAGAAGAAEKTVSETDRTGLALTLYADGFGLVKDRRTVELAAGANTLAFEGVSARMVPSSALVRSETGLSVLEQNFEFDLISPQALLERSVGQTVRVIRTNPATGEETVEQAQVLAAENGTVLRIGDRIETGVPGRLVFDSVPEGLRAKPALLLDVESNVAAARDVQLAYLTEGVAWKAEYVAELGPEGRTLDLGGWASLSNSTGTDFANAEVQLVAGDVPREVQPKRFNAAPMMARAEAADSSASGAASRESLGELHLYTLPRPVTLKNNQTKQVALLSGADVGMTREYRRERWVPEREPRLAGATEPAAHPLTSIRFANETENNLGVPLPAGLVRVYQRDSDGRLQFAGERSVGHTAAGEDLALSLGEAVDVGLHYEQTDFKVLGGQDGPYESAQEIRLTNAKAEPVTVRLVERFPGAVEILSESQEHDAFSGREAQWSVEVPAGGETVLAYRARVTRVR